MNILDQIVSERRADVADARRRVPLRDLAAAARGRRHHSLAERLALHRGPAVIAEMKKASPSAGMLCPDYRPAEIARRYERAGAAAVSVLTEPRRFLGGGQDLRDVRAATGLPVLRKDFLCDPYQVYEAAAWGADAVLLIVAALEPSALRELYEAARGCGLDVLAEAHNREELDRALGLEAAIVGVNSRDLRTLRTDPATARALAAGIPADRRSVAESGLRSRADIREMEALGYDGFLIGEALMRAADPAARLRSLLGHDEAGKGDGT